MLENWIVAIIQLVVLSLEVFSSTPELILQQQNLPEELEFVDQISVW